ncbi:Clavaminate synthase-like protein [Choiromyces venosus 120613-1]|uniref:Clavaminate synthase-like protein n=1 Tax=Choiromyces venosus 120613-1 TaxID=1336337 RepID=A0A3N4K3Z2_9PEZI|nr:Clavaminate synthase-like protein [Choiromyces venosus 120613-1]
MKDSILSQYKEFGYGANTFNKEAEVKGIGKPAPAKRSQIPPPQLEPFTHHDPGKLASPTLSPQGVKTTPAAPNFGTEIHGLQLHGLSPSAKDDLALLTARCGGYAGKFEERTGSVAWHPDATYEKQSPGTTFLYALEITHRRRRRWGGIVRREPITSVHPVVRTHPATKKEESDALLKFLYEHISQGIDFQIRVRWEPKTVVVWDNRVTAHTALFGWDSGARRHIVRITPQAEAPAESF